MALGITALAGTAFAYWTTTGSGTATSTTSLSLATLTTTQNGSVTGMAPAAAIQDVNFTINNSAASPQYVTTVALSITGVTWTAAAGAGTGTVLANHHAGDSAGSRSLGRTPPLPAPPRTPTPSPPSSAPHGHPPKQSSFRSADRRRGEPNPVTRVPSPRYPAVDGPLQRSAVRVPNRHTE